MSGVTFNSIEFNLTNVRKAAMVEVEQCLLPPLTVHDDSEPLTTTKVLARLGPFLGVAYRYPDHEDHSDDQLREIALYDLAKDVRKFVDVLIDHEILT